MSLRPDPTPAPSAAPIVALRLALRCRSPTAFAHHYWRLVKEDRILLVTGRARPPGTRLRFTIVLTDGTEVLRGEGRVARARRSSGAAHWLEVVFQPLDGPSRRQLEVLRALRAAHGREPPAATEEFEEGPTTPIDRGALDEFDEARVTDRIDRGALDRRGPPPPPPVRRAVPPPIPRDVAGPPADEEEQFVADFAALWHSLPTGRIVRLCAGELEVEEAAAPPAVEAPSVVVCESARLPPLPVTGPIRLPPAAPPRGRTAQRILFVAALLFACGTGIAALWHALGAAAAR